jgi:hypothetical protein
MLLSYQITGDSAKQEGTSSSDHDNLSNPGVVGDLGSSFITTALYQV